MHDPRSFKKAVDVELGSRQMFLQRMSLVILGQESGADLMEVGGFDVVLGCSFFDGWRDQLEV